jgi:hypothetical protein
VLQEIEGKKNKEAARGVESLVVADGVEQR